MIRFRSPLLMLICLGLTARIARATDPASSDDRLKQRLRMSEHASLAKIADDLTAKTGVTIHAGSGDRDWKVRERDVALELRDIPLGDALAGIARTLGYELHRSGADGHWTYRIWQSARGREYEDAMRTTETEAHDQQIAAARDLVLKDAGDMRPLSPEEAAKLRESDPWKAYLWGTDAGRAYCGLVNALPDDTKELIRLGRKVDLSISDLSSDQQAAVRRMVSGGVVGKGMIGGGAALHDFTKAGTPARLVFMPMTEDLKRGIPENMGIAGMAVVMGDVPPAMPDLNSFADESDRMGLGHQLPMALMPLVGSAGMGRLFGQSALRLDSGEAPDQVNRDFNRDVRAGAASWPRSDDGAAGGTSGGAASGSASAAANASDPVLDTLIDPLTVDHPITILSQLADQTHLTFIVESYPDVDLLPFLVPRAKTTLRKLLDSLGRGGLDWTLGSRVVSLKPRDWALERSYDVPVKLLDGYKQILATNGWLDLDALGALAAALTDDQIRHRVLLEPDIRDVGEDLLTGRNRDLLRFYGGLSADEKTRLKDHTGLPLDSLTEAQWSAMAHLVEDQAEEVTTGTVRLTLGPAPVSAAGAPGAVTPPAALDGAGHPIHTLFASFRVDLRRDGEAAPIQWSRDLKVPTKEELALRRGSRNGPAGPAGNGPAGKAAPSGAVPASAK